MTAITSNGTGGGNWSATASWTGATVPVEGDTAIIQNGDTITIDQNITVGADTSTAAIDAASGGKLEVLSTVAADYTLTLKGDLKISSGGTLEIGTVANPIPAARKFTIELNYSAALAEGKYGLLNYGEMILQGDPARITVIHCLLNADAAVDATGLVSDVSTGWKDNDKIAIASTSRTWSEVEDGTMNGNASGTALTIDGFAGVSGGLASAHQGTDNSQGDSCRAEIINLTRNVKITSYNASYNSYILFEVDSTCDIDYAEFYELGSNIADKYGVTVKTETTLNIHYCSFYNMYRVLNVIAACGTLLTFDNNVVYNIAHRAVYTNTVKYVTITNNVIMKAADYGMYIAPNINADDNVITSCYNGIFITGGSYAAASFDNINIHSNEYRSYFLLAIQTINNLKYWRNGSTFYTYAISMKDCICYGNYYHHLRTERALSVFDTCRFYSESSYTTSYGIYIIGGAGILIKDCEIGTDGAHPGDILCGTGCITCNVKNSKLSSVVDARKMTNGSYIQCEDLGQVQYIDKAWYRNGIVVRDSSIKKSGSYSTRFDFQYNNAEWLEYDVYIPVKSGEQITVSAWLRKNASYTDANRPKIVLSGQGITEDEAQMTDVTDTWERVTVQGTPTRTGLAKLTIKTYLVNSGASAWADFVKTDILSGVLNTIEGDFWADGHIAEVFMDTGSITPAEFWKTLTADVNSTGSFAKLFKDYVDAAISDVPNAVWDEPVAEHTIVGTFGRLISKKLLTVAKFIGLK